MASARADGVALPLAQGRLGDVRVVVREERTLTELDTEVARVGISGDDARVLPRVQCDFDQFVESELLGPGHLDGAVDRRCQRDLAQCVSHVIGRDGLHEYRWQADRVTFGGGVGDAFDELEELCGVQDRV